jgi:SAM-dependent methyltransferase
MRAGVLTEARLGNRSDASLLIAAGVCVRCGSRDVTILKRIYAQFGRPTGPLGALAGFIMAHRTSNRERNAWTVELLDLKPNDRVLEIGFGPGLSLALAAQKVTQGEIVGLDHSAVMLAQATNRNRDAIARGRMRLVLGSVDSLALGQTAFTKVFSVNVAMFWKDRGATLGAVRNIMTPGGLLATTHQPRHAGSVAEDARRFAEAFSRDLARAGFRDVRVEHLRLKPIPAVCIVANA